MHTTTGPTIAAAAAAAYHSDHRSGATHPHHAASPDPGTGIRPAADRFGLGVAAITPFAADGTVDLPRLVAHARRCLAEGCSSVTLFGTTGEGASLGFRERARMLDGFVAAGFDMRAQVLGGVAASAIEDAAAQARHIYAAGGARHAARAAVLLQGSGRRGALRLVLARHRGVRRRARASSSTTCRRSPACRCRSTSSAG